MLLFFYLMQCIAITKVNIFIFIDNIHHKNKDVNKTCFFVNAVISRLFTVDILISRFI